MTKELEALECLNKIQHNFGQLKGQELVNCFETISKALTELQAIKEAKPSEALECLEYIEQKLGGLKYECERTKNHRCDDLFIQEHIFTTIQQALLKAEKLEKELADVEKVKSGKTIIYIGKDLVMMNKAKYYEYLENKNEPVSKRILQAKCETQEQELAKYKKAWEVVKEKNVNVSDLKCCDSVEAYNIFIGTIEYQLTEEEFELIKEMLLP